MKNQIELSGHIVSEFEFDHEAYGEKFFILKMNVRRSSGVIDTIKLICSDCVIEIKKEMIGKYVSITGQLRTHNINRHLVIGVYVESMDILDISDVCVDENLVELNGYVCKKSSIRTTPYGRVILDTIIAVNRNKNHNDYLPVIFWGKNAGSINDVPIGTEVSLSGRFQSRYYMKNEEEHVVYEVSAQEVEYAKV